MASVHINSTPTNFLRSLNGLNVSWLLVRFLTSDYSALLPTVWDPPQKVVWRHAIKILIVVGRYDCPILIPWRCMLKVKHLTVTQINADFMPSHPRSPRTLFGSHDPHKYWPMSLLLHFRCSNGDWTYWLVHCGMYNVGIRARWAVGDGLLVTPKDGGETCYQTLVITEEII